MKQLILALIAAFAAAIRTNREDTEEIKKLKQQNEELKEKLRQEDLEDSEIEELAPQIEELLTLATAARPPSEDQVGIAKTGFGGVAVTQDPAQPAGQKEAGNPEVEKKLAEGGTEEKTEEEEVTVDSLVNDNTKDELLEKAEEAGIEVSSSATKAEIAEAIVNKQSE